MGLFTKKTDPFTDRTKALNSEIAALEAQIKKLSQQLDQGAPPASAASKPPVRNTPAPAQPARASQEVFEEIERNPFKAQPEGPAPAEFYNELGVRKYDITALFAKLQALLRGRPAANPKLVNYLAAGSIHGLRPLRYEKRVARNRFIALTVVLLLTCWGIVAVFLRP